MAETVTIEGQPYLKRNPLGVLGLSFMTLGIYFLYWYYKVNDELQRFEHDAHDQPDAFADGDDLRLDHHRAAVHRDVQHRQARPRIEERMSIQPQLEPALVIIFMLLFSIGNGLYIQEHLNRIWDRGSGARAPAPQLHGSVPPLPPMPG